MKHTRRCIPVLLLLLIPLLVGPLLSRVSAADGGWADYRNPQDISALLAQREELPLESILVDAVAERGDYVFVCYRTEADGPSTFAFCEKLTSGKITCRGGGPVSGDLDTYQLRDSGLQIFVVFGNNRAGHAQQLEFEMDEISFQKEIEPGYFVAPFLMYTQSDAFPMTITLGEA